MGSASYQVPLGGGRPTALVLVALGGASLILQQFATEGHDSWRLERQLGLGVALCFVCEDAIAIFRGARARGLEATEPQVGNAMWVTSMIGPDGYQIRN